MRYIIVLITILLFSCNNSEDKEIEITQQQKFDSSLSKAAVLIRQFIENKEPNERYAIEGEQLYSTILLPKYYIENEFKAGWFTNFNKPIKANEMLQFINQLEFHGLIPKQYHQALIAEKLTEIEEDSSLIYNPNFIYQLDVLLSDAFLITASHLYHGKVSPESLKAVWNIQRNKPELALDVKLRTMLESDNISTFFEDFFPPQPGYKIMVSFAQQLKELKPNDFAVRINPNMILIKPNEKSEYLPEIREKLLFLGLYTLDSNFYSTHYDFNTQQAVKNLQAQFGFNTDAVLGPNTLKALNTPIEDLIKKLYVNMERLRWMPDSLEEKYIFVNIVDYALIMRSDTDTLIAMRTVVGKNYRQTPVFHSTMSYLVFSPTWTVPPLILRNDLIPAVSKNMNYLAENNFVVLDAGGSLVDPTSINFQQNGMRYTFRQKPGKQNALGRVKFMFPNKYSVYIHDTPSKELFARDERSFSSGCIRIEKPFELAKILLSDMPNWTEDKIKLAMSSTSEQTVVLKTPVGVHLYYLTAWVNTKGEIQFRNDIYDRDSEVYEALLLEYN